MAVSAHPGHVFEGRVFDFNDPKGVNAISFVVESPLEPIVGTAHDITGLVKFDSNHVDQAEGKIIVLAKSIQTANTNMTRILHGEDWLDITRKPTASFQFKFDGENFTGLFLLAGKVHEVVAPGSLTVVPNGATRRGGGRKGDLLVLRSTFVLDRTLFGIQPDLISDKVGREIRIHVGIVGYPVERLDQLRR